MASSGCCGKMFSSKKVECQIGDKGGCAFCVKVPSCKGGKISTEQAKIFCCKPEEFEKCCKAQMSNDNECCVCCVCENNKIVKVIVVESGGKQSEMQPKPGQAVCVSVPQSGGGQVQVKQCEPGALEGCCKATTESGDCSCVCLCSKDGVCSAIVRCPQQPQQMGTSMPCC